MRKRSCHRDIDYPEHAARATDKPLSANKALAALGPVVYAVQTRDGLIKIGHTSNLSVRRRQFNSTAEPVLAFRFGSLDDEQAIHESLRGLAVKGREYYPWAAPVVACVNEMRADLGLDPLAEVAA